jgi:hypothetical protein
LNETGGAFHAIEDGLVLPGEERGVNEV